MKLNKKINVFALDVDSETLKQFEECYSQKFVVAATLMPDAHSGYVAPIGAVLQTKDFIVPSWVGFDIGCGLIAVKIQGKNIFEKVKKNSEKIYNEVKKRVPMGLGLLNNKDELSEETKIKFKELVKKLESSKHNKNLVNFIKQTGERNLGSLGSGNHFIELGFFKKELWLIIHSGSRNIGHKTAETYMKKSADSEKEYEKTFPIKADSELGKEYLNVLEFCLDFALQNRLEISKKVIKIIEEIIKEKINSKLWVNKNHNHAVLENKFYIHRKGATPAKKGERGIIPANMRDGTFLVKGLGNKNFLYSSSHGAGRLKSRSQARKTISIAEFQDSMKGIVGTITEKTIDESPMAYKNINLVMEAQKDSVKIIKQIKPIINWKGV